MLPFNKMILFPGCHKNVKRRLAQPYQPCPAPALSSLAQISPTQRLVACVVAVFRGFPLVSLTINSTICSVRFDCGKWQSPRIHILFIEIASLDRIKCYVNNPIDNDY